MFVRAARHNSVQQLFWRPRKPNKENFFVRLYHISFDGKDVKESCQFF